MSSHYLDFSSCGGFANQVTYFLCGPRKPLCSISKELQPPGSWILLYIGDLILGYLILHNKLYLILHNTTARFGFITAYLSSDSSLF